MYAGKSSEVMEKVGKVAYLAIFSTFYPDRFWK
jgi:hypothetical protein